MDLNLILPQFGGAAFTIVSFVVALSVIVAIHEYGHYIVGRWTGIHAEVFSLGFGPVLFSRVDRRGTRWQVAALPFGGYVRFLGDTNAASIRSLSGGPTDRNTMAGAPVWARALTVAAGPAFNFALSILVFATLIMLQGRTTDPLTVAELHPLPASYGQGLQAGDAILSIEGQDIPAFSGLRDFARTLPARAALTYTVDRQGATAEVQGPYPYASLIASVTPGSAAYQAGLQGGDVIVAIDGQPVATFDQIIAAVSTSDGRALTFDIWRDGTVTPTPIAPRRVDLPTPDGGFDTVWLIGVTGALVFEPRTEKFGPVDSLGYGAGQVWYIARSSISALAHIVTGDISSCNLSGPIGIAKTSGAMAAQGASNFIWFIAILSTAVGLLNLFPIPVLDGGHLVFHAYEVIARRKPSDLAVRLLMGLGLTVILTMTFFALANDLFLCP